MTICHILVLLYYKFFRNQNVFSTKITFYSICEFCKIMRLFNLFKNFALLPYSFFINKISKAKKLRNKPLIFI